MTQSTPNLIDTKSTTVLPADAACETMSVVDRLMMLLEADAADASDSVEWRAGIQRRQESVLARSIRERIERESGRSRAA